MTKIKILHIIKSLGRGGAETLLPETLKLHDRDCFDFHYIYFLPWKDQMVDSLIANGGQVTCLKAGNNILLILKIRAITRYLKKHNIQLIHAHLPWAGIVARIVGRLTGIPIIYTEHNKQERYHVITRTMNLFTMNWVSHIIAVSEDVAQSIRRAKPNLKVPLQIILHGVNVYNFSPGLYDGTMIRYALGIPEDAPVIGTMAVFRFQKRLDLWLEIANKIHDKVSSAHFIIVGDGPLKQMLLEKSMQLKLGNKVHFVGLQAEVRPYLAAFDLYMMSSIFEGLPIALLEAMASGCPVITTDAGGIREVIRHNVDGLTCDVNEPEKLIQYAIDLFDDKAKRRALGTKGRKRIEEAFSMDKMVLELEKLYYAF